jgi:hypothetical protein
MHLNPDSRREFSQLYLQEYGVSLTDEQADEMGWELLELMDLLLQPQKSH